MVSYSICKEAACKHASSYFVGTKVDPHHLTTLHYDLYNEVILIGGKI